MKTLISTTKLNRFALLTAGVLSCLIGNRSHAANITKADVTDVLALGTSWNGGTAPTNTDIAIWDSNVVVNATSFLGNTSLSWQGIQILNPAGTITINTNTSGTNLTIGASGIDMSLATTNLVMSNTVTLGAGQTWNVGNGLILTAASAISGANALTKNGPGTLVLVTNNTYTGATTINGGTVVPVNATSFGAAAALVTNNNSTLNFGSVGSGSFPNGGIIANPFTIVGNTSIDMANRNTSVVLDGSFSGTGTILITNDTSSGSTLTLGGNGSGGGTMSAFTGSLIVADTNSAGAPSAGSLRFNNGGGNNNLGNAAMTLNLGGPNSSIHFTEKNSGTTTHFGALIGGPNTQLASVETYVIGEANLNTTFAGTITGSSASLTKSGTATLILTGNNGNSGTTTISAGTLQIGDGLVANGQLGTGTIADNAKLVFARPDPIAIANVISGNGTLVQSTASSLTLSGASTFSGSIVVTNNGSVIVGAPGAITNTASVILGGSGTAGTLDLGGNNVQVTALNMGAGATGATIGSTGGTIPTVLTVNATNGTSIFNGTIQDTLPTGGSGTVALTVQNGKLTLGGVDTYTGPTTISNGTLALAIGGSISSSPTMVLAGNNSAVLDASAVGGFSLSGAHTLSGNGSVIGSVTAPANSTIIPGTLGTSGTLSFSNNLNLNSVTSDFDLTTSTTSGNDQVIVGGTLNLSGVNVIQVNPVGGLLSAGTYRLFVCGSVTGGAGNLQLLGSPGSGLVAALNVTATEVDLVVTVTAAPFIWHGDGALNKWDYTTTNWRSNGVSAVFADGDFTLFDNTGSTSPAIDITTPVSPALVTVNASVNYKFGSISGLGKITGAGGLIKTNSGTLILATPNDFTGGMTIGQGTLQIGDGSAFGSSPGNSGILNNGSLVFDQPDAYEFTNAIAGTGSVAQTGSSTLTLSGNNTYSGATTVNASGILQIGDGNTSGNLGTNTVFDSGSLVFNRSDSLIQSGLITGIGTLTQAGTGTLTVTASNDFSGGTLIAAGTLRLGNGGATGSVPLATITNNGTLAFNHSIDETNNTPIIGVGGISKQATNTLTLKGANTYNGNTSISAGTLKIGVQGTIPNGPGFGNIVLNGGASAAGTLDINGIDTTLNGLTGSTNTVVGQIVNNGSAGTNVLTIGNGDTTTTGFSGTIVDNTNGGAGRIALVKIGFGSITLNNTNTYTGGTIISNGTLATGNAGANNTGAFSAFGPTNNPILFNGGGLNLFNSTSDNTTVYTFYNPLIVPAGQTGTLTMFERGDLFSTLTGGGTLFLNSPGVRGTLAGNWSAFTGTIVAASGQARINNTAFGYTNSIWVITNSADLDTGADGNPGASGQTVRIGELDGDTSGFIGNGAKPSANQTWSIGWLNTTSTFAGTIVAGTGNSVTKVGTGTLVLSGQNTYTGTTTISNGVLALVEPGSIDATSATDINAGTVLDATGRADGTLNVYHTLRGNGTVKGSVVANSGATIAPGENGIGILTITNVLTLVSGSTNVMDLNKAGGTNDVITGMTTLNYGGTLKLNYSDQRVIGDHFTLFHAGAYNGAFDAIIPSKPGTALAWDTSKLTLNGTLAVIAGTPARITSVTFDGTTFTINGSGGTPNENFNVLTSTDLTLPLSQWTVATTGSFDGLGVFTTGISATPGSTQQFFTLQFQ